MDPTDNTAPEVDQPEVPVDAEAPEVETEPGTSEETLAPFNINDVPEEYREHVAAYNTQLRSAFDRKTGEWATERKQWESQAEALEEAQRSWEALQSDPEYQAQVRDQLDAILNAEAAGEQTDDLDPAALALSRIEALEQSIEQSNLTQQQQAQNEAELAQMSEQLSSIETEAERELTDREVRILTSYAITNPNAEGLPDLEAAWVEYQAALGEQTTAKQTAYKQSKIAPTAPSGVAVTNDLIPNTKEARVQQMADIISAE
jgi:hypothetical protein